MINNGIFRPKRLPTATRRVKSTSKPSIDSLMFNKINKQSVICDSQYFQTSRKTTRPQTSLQLPNKESLFELPQYSNDEETKESKNKDVYYHTKMKLFAKKYSTTMPTHMSTQQSIIKSQPLIQTITKRTTKTNNSLTKSITKKQTIEVVNQQQILQPTTMNINQLFSQIQQIRQEPRLLQCNLDNIKTTKKILQINLEEIKALYDELAHLDVKFMKMTADTEVFIHNLYADKNKFLKIKDNVLTEHQLQFLTDQLKIKRELLEQGQSFDSINFDEIDKIVQKLIFFERFTKSTRINLVKLGQYIEVPPGEYVFHQGDFGDNLFVILSGSVVVKIEKKFNQFGPIIEQVVSSLYDGQHFGELAMMETTQKGSEEVLEEKLENINIKSLKEVKEQLIKQQLQDLGQQDEAFQKQKIKELQRQNTNIINLVKEDNIKEKHYIMNLANNDELGQSSGLTKSNNIQYKKVDKVQQRKASIQASETCHLLAISRENFKNILMVLMQDELEQKIKMLKSLRFFKQIQPFVLIPLANQLIPQRFHLDEVLVKEGDILEYMYIIYKGSCNKELNYQNIFEKKKQNRKSYRYYQEHPKKVIHNEPQDYLSCLTQDGDITYKIPDYAVCNNNNGYIQYQKSYIYKKLYPGDIIFGRVLTGLRLEGDKGTDRARMTVVSSSSTTIVYKISLKLIQFCPEFLIEHLTNQLLVYKEVDLIEKSELNQEIRQIYSKNSNIMKDQAQLLSDIEEKQRKLDLQEYYKRNKLRKPQNEKKQDLLNLEWELFKEKVMVQQLLYNKVSN
ncbi:unnamed protein product [Paramecium pentaurelia]|uniref:Cyclic nucleotide-binding domain-containing protein n=1 Tax=Paramecium pentaurelia TaxID=43138 RepID=A0A8S1X1U3_9CILI|nr:unnamed protein product [Paramecium pentaurelia]